MTSRILGIGLCSGPTRIAQEKTAELVLGLGSYDEDSKRLLRSLHQKSGIDARSTIFDESQAGPNSFTAFHSSGSEKKGPGTAARIARFADEAPSLAIAASKLALAEAGKKATEVRQLVTVSCTGFRAPGVDVDLIRDLELPLDVGRTNIGFMGCHGMFNALRVAAALAEAAPLELVLVSSVEISSLHFSRSVDPNDIVGGALFADGASSAIVGHQNSASASEENWAIASHGSLLIPDTEEYMSWIVGDHGFQLTLSPKVPDVIVSSLKPWIEEWLARNGLSVREIASWAVHPGGPRIIDSVEKALGLSRAQTAASRKVLAAHGNMSSATILFVLKEIRLSGGSLPCVALGFGPGLTTEATLFA